MSVQRGKDNMYPFPLFSQEAIVKSRQFETGARHTDNKLHILIHDFQHAITTHLQKSYVFENGPLFSLFSSFQYSWQ